MAVAVLAGHLLAFHKIGRDGSAKCDAVASRDPDAQLYGVVYRIDPAHKAGLDAAEGLGNGYDQKPVEVLQLDGTRSSAFTYYATHIDPRLSPYPWYKEHVLRGARAHQMPHHYIAMIGAIETIEDPDPQRQADELAIYR